MRYDVYLFFKSFRSTVLNPFRITTRPCLFSAISTNKINKPYDLRVYEITTDSAKRNPVRTMTDKKNKAYLYLYAVFGLHIFVRFPSVRPAKSNTLLCRRERTGLCVSQMYNDRFRKKCARLGKSHAVALGGPPLPSVEHTSVRFIAYSAKTLSHFLRYSDTLSGEGDGRYTLDPSDCRKNKITRIAPNISFDKTLDVVCL